ncbi:DUF4166 domain-containing protein [Neptuniibacter sp. QD34_54]|uniref:DUF4166 domain-containing protein n=1 Tax=Neptuniibacter sp. QD34_54 TaxID=3398208 RepID=UPI0039F5D2E5
MTSALVQTWFGDKFSELHPQLQQLHIQGGELKGLIDLTYGSGLAGIIGRRLAKKMGLPTSGQHQLSVNISHKPDGLHWGRCFNDQERVISIFKPVGSIEDGYWIEETGPITLHLTVDIKEDGWFWRCLKIKIKGVTVPTWLLPKTTAYKKIENGKYRFFVGFSLPILGSLVSYQGLLCPEVANEH